MGHTLNTLRHIITKKSHNVLSEFTMLCWAEFLAVLSRTWPAGRKLDTPAVHPRDWPLWCEWGAPGREGGGLPCEAAERGGQELPHKLGGVVPQKL